MKSQSFKPYAPVEDNALIKWANEGVSLSEQAKRLGRHYDSIKHRRRVLGITNQDKWTPEKVERVLSEIQTIATREKVSTGGLISRIRKEWYGYK